MRGCGALAEVPEQNAPVRGRPVKWVTFVTLFHLLVFVKGRMGWHWIWVTVLQLPAPRAHLQ